MIKPSLKILLPALAVALTPLAAWAANTYSTAVMALNPVGYWPLNETTPPPPLFVASNSGTLGSQGDGFFNNPNYRSGVSYSPQSLFAGDTPVPGATSDGDAAVEFNGGLDGNDNTGFLEIPDINHGLDDAGTGTAFTAEAWVMPGGGDPNDLTGSSFASTEWAAIIKKGGGVYFYTENGDPNNQNTYGWTISMAGCYVLGPGNWGWDEAGTAFLQTNACWVVDFYNGGNGNVPSLEFDVPFQEPTPSWFHLALSYDGTNANFYVNGALAATTVPGLPQSTNTVISPGQPPLTSATGLYQFKTANGVGYAPDTMNPLVLGNINETYSYINLGFPALGYIGFNCQCYNGAMDEVAVYTNTMTAATVLKHYQDATAANTTLYTNDVLSAAPPVYLRFDEPASSFVEPADFSSYPAANNLGSQPAAGGLYQPGVMPGIAGPTALGLGSASQAVQINGLDASVDIGAGALYQTTLDPQGTQPFSISFWFKADPSDCPIRFQGILGRGDSGWRSSLDTGGHVRWNPGNGPEIASPQNCNDGAWHHVVGVSDGSTTYLYVDGTLSTSATGVGSLSGSPYDLFIGGAPDYTADYGTQSTTSGPGNNQGGYGQRYFDGQVTQVAAFTNALLSTDVQNLYAAAEVIPYFTANPQDVSIGLGGTATLSVSALGLNVAYQWFQGTQLLSNVSGNILGATNSTLTITNAQLSNGGNYMVVITNTYGSVTSTVATVTIIPTPEITAQPASTSVALYAGNEAAFQLTAIGALPLTYYWSQNGTVVSSATVSNVVVTPPAGTNHYFCIVSNSYGSATSSIITVTAQAYVAPPQGLIVNFATAPGSTASQVYVGLGAYSDYLTNTEWNPFSGTSGAATGYAFDSASNQVLVTASLIFGFNNGAPGATQGTPGYLESYEDAVNATYFGIGNSTTPEGQLTINDLPQRTYDVYIYGANYDGDRGSAYNLAPVNGGSADQGITNTVNGSVNGLNAVAGGHCTFAEGDNYVLFHGVVPDAFGNITVDYIPFTNPLSGNSGEAPLNGIQLVSTVATTPTVTIQSIDAQYVLTWSPASASLYSSTNVAGPWSAVGGATTPYTNNPVGGQMFFRVK